MCSYLPLKKLRCKDLLKANLLIYIYLIDPWGSKSDAYEEKKNFMFLGIFILF